MSGFRSAPRGCVPLLALGWALLLVLGCASTGGGAAAGSQAATTAARRVLATRYLAIAQAGNHRLDHDFDALHKRDADHLAAAQADLRDIAATEHLFDRQLAGIVFPAQIETTARQLIIVNQTRARLTLAAASITSLADLHGFLPLLDQANGPVEAAVRLIRGQLGLPPPQTS